MDSVRVKGKMLREFGRDERVHPLGCTLFIWGQAMKDDTIDGASSTRNGRLEAKVEGTIRTALGTSKN